MQYFIPGLWCLIIFKYISNKSIHHTYIAIFSCAISYILLSITEVIFIKITCLTQFKNNIYIRSFTSVIIGTIFSIVIGIVYHTKVFGFIMKLISNKTQYNEIWRDVIDFKATNLKLYIRDEDYYVYGHFRNIEENKKDPWIAVYGYGKFNKVTNKLLENEPNHMGDDKNDDKKNIFIIKISDVEHIEKA